MTIQITTSVAIDFESWVVGFIEGEGCPTYTHGGRYPEFTLVQNEREILERVSTYLGMGQITCTSNKKAWQNLHQQQEGMAAKDKQHTRL